MHSGCKISSIDKNDRLFQISSKSSNFSHFPSQVALKYTGFACAQWVKLLFLRQIRNFDDFGGGSSVKVALNLPAHF
jgi:hypothetical protein